MAFKFAFTVQPRKEATFILSFVQVNPVHTFEREWGKYHAEMRLFFIWDGSDAIGSVSLYFRADWASGLW
jgi:hypothetical protein